MKKAEQNTKKLLLKASREELFCQIVDPFLERLEKLGKELAEVELGDISLGTDMDKKFMEFLWHNQKEVQLLLEKSDGTRYGNFKDQVFFWLERSFSQFFKKYGNMGDHKNLIGI